VGSNPIAHPREAAGQKVRPEERPDLLASR
jgi:hypothetical protein